MQNRDKKSYDIIFDQIKQAWDRLELEPSFRYIFMDFEKALLNSAIEAFGLNVSSS